MTTRTDSNKRILLITVIFCVYHRGVTRSLVSLTQEGGPYVVGDAITLRCTFAVSPPTTTISKARLDTSVSGSYVTVYQYDAASNVTTISDKYRQGNVTGRLGSDGKSYLFILHNSQLSDTGSYRCSGVLSDGSRPRRAAVTSVVVNQTTESAACLSDPCLNAGTCVNDVNNYTCTCAACFTGVNCEIAITSLCVPSPCKNGGVCDGSCLSYSCTCPAGTTGTNCEIETDACLSNPCQNFGTCVGSMNNYTCTCTDCFTGTICENAMTNLCDWNPCENGGTCDGNCISYRCTCPAGTTGINCQKEGSFPWWLILVIVLIIFVILTIIIVILVYYWDDIKHFQQPKVNRVGTESGKPVKHIVPYASRYTFTTTNTSGDPSREVKMTLSYLPEINRYRALQPLDVEAERRKLRKQRIKKIQCDEDVC